MPAMYCEAIQQYDVGGTKASEQSGEGDKGFVDVDGVCGGLYVDLPPFVEFRLFDSDLGLPSRILTPSRVESIGK